MTTVVEGQPAFSESDQHIVSLPQVSISPAQDESLSDEETFHDAVSELAASPTRKTSAPDPLAPTQDGAHDASNGETAPLEPVESEPSEPSDPKQIEDRAFGLVEFYFGEDNYSKDQFLRKQAQQDPTFQGWISVDVIASFKKMKKITENRDVVLAAIRRSSLVLLNEDATMVRRRELLAKDVEDALARTVLLGNLPSTATEESVRAMCSPHGTVVRVRFHVADRDAFPEDVARYCVDETGAFRTGVRLYPGRLYAFVEYTNSKHANIAIKALHNVNDWRVGLSACMLHKKIKGEGSPMSSQCSSHVPTREASPFLPSVSSMIVERARSNSFNSRLHREKSPGPTTLGQTDASSRVVSASQPDLPNFGGSPAAARAAQMRSPSALTPRSPTLSPQSARRHLGVSPTTRTPSGAPSPVVRSSLGLSSDSPPAWRPSPGTVRSPPTATVTRQPIGPDGTRGFAQRVPPVLSPSH